MKNKIDFANENTGKALFQMAMPLFLATVLMLAYNLVDSIWVGNLLGENGYAALTTAGSVSILLYAFTTGVGNGTAIVVSRLVGNKDEKKIRKITGAILLISALFSVLLTAVLEFSLDRILQIFHTPMDIYRDAWIYLAIFLPGYVAVFLYMQLTSIYRSFGDPVFQMKGMFLGTLINLITDPLFIRSYGISGAATATVLSQVICLVFAILYGRKKAYFSPNLNGCNRENVKDFVTTVIPASMQNCIPAISSMVMVILVNRYDVTTIAAYGVVKNIENFLFYPAMAMNMSMITITGHLYGAEKPERIKDYMKTALIYGTLIEGILTVLVLFSSGRISMAFVHEEVIASIASRGLWIIGIGYPCYMITNIFLGKLSGMGKVNLSLLLMFFYYIVIRLPLALILMDSPLRLDGMWFSFLISHISAVLIAVLLDHILCRAPKEYPSAIRTADTHTKGETA